MVHGCRLGSNRTWFLAGVVGWGFAAGAMCQDEASVKDASPDPDLPAVEQLLNLAWSGDGAAFAAVNDHYESHRGQVTDEPRWHYAYGVGLLKLKKYPPAVAAFQAALRDAREFRLSAWKGLIWTELNLKHAEAALEHLERLAALVADHDFAGTDDEREQAATWIGQTLAAVEKINAAEKIRQQLSQLNETLDSTWNHELLACCQEGRDYTNSLYEELMDQLDQASAEARQKELQQRAEKQGQIDDSVSDADEKRTRLQKLAEETRRMAEQRLLQIDKQLVRLDRDYAYLEARAISVLQSISLAQNEIQDLQRQRSGPFGQNSFRSPLGTSLDQQIQQLQAAIGRYQLDLENTSMRAALVSQQAMTGLQTRQQLVQQAQSASSELSGQQTALSKWQDRLTQSAEKLQKSQLKGDSLSVRTKRLKAKNLNTYLEFDPEWERIQLTERPAKS